MAILSCFPNTGSLSITGGNMQGSINMNEHKISGVGTPENADEAANKEYIDGLVGDVESLLETI